MSGARENQRGKFNEIFTSLVKHLFGEGTWYNERMPQDGSWRWLSWG
jgi:hypothetical protein